MIRKEELVTILHNLRPTNFLQGADWSEATAAALVKNEKGEDANEEVEEHPAAEEGEGLFKVESLVRKHAANRDAGPMKRHAEDAETPASVKRGASSD